MSAYFEWPPNLVPRTINIRPPSDTKSSSQSLTNFRQVVPTIRPPWRVELKFPTFTTRAKILAYRATLAMFEGRANLVRLPLFDFYMAGTAFEGFASHSDGSPFSDYSLYSQEDLIGISYSGAQGERLIEIDFDVYGECIEAGQYFGLDNHFYMARRVWWDGTVATLEITSTLRKTYTDAQVRLRPWLVCGLITDDVGDHPLDYGQWTSPELMLEEQFSDVLY